MDLEQGMLKPKYVELHQNCLAALQEKYSVEKIVNNHFTKLEDFLEDYYLYRPYNIQMLLEAHWIRQDDLKVIHCLIATDKLSSELGEEVEHEKPVLTDPYQFFLIDLKKDYGKALIRPETFGDKVFEVLIPQEIDFPEHPGFSDKYYFYTDEDNKEKTRAAMTPEILEAIYQYDELVIQIVRNIMLVKRLRRITPEDCQELAAFSFQLKASLKK